MDVAKICRGGSGQSPRILRGLPILSQYCNAMGYIRGPGHLLCDSKITS